MLYNWLHAEWENLEFFVVAMFLKIAQQLRALVTAAADGEGHNRLALTLW